MTIAPPPVCILTAGTGRRSAPLSDTINKCLLPYKGKAIISHIIEQFPCSTSFVIAVGYRDDQVRAYLELMHPEYEFCFIQIDNYEKEGSGPGYSLLCCKAALGNCFYFVAGDGVFEKIPTNKCSSWLGLTKLERDDLTSYCNLEYETNGMAVIDIFDKKQPPKTKNTGVFSGIMFIKDAKDFWHSLENLRHVGEREVSLGFQALVKSRNVIAEIVSWHDLGTLELYNKAIKDSYDFSKIDEFLYISQKYVVKFFADENISAKRVQKTKIVPEVFPKITGRLGQFYAYRKVPGKTMYENWDKKLFADLLIWLKDRLWKKKKVTPEKIQEICSLFYRDKTNQRLKLYNEKYPNWIEPNSVNKKPVQPINKLLSRIPVEIYRGIPVFIHGDLQFDNIITDGKNFMLIDWRQDFAGQIEFGDWYYDLAKLLGGIHLNYDYIKQGKMSYNEVGADVTLKYSTRSEETEYRLILKDFVEKEGLDFQRVEILRGLIYLNMAPLHQPPFDKLLYALAQTTLSDVLKC